MPPETKPLSDYPNVISSEMDLKDHIRSGELDGYAIRDFIVKNTSFAEKHFSNVLIHRITANGISFDEFEGKALQLTQGEISKASFRFAEFDELNMQNCQARDCTFDQAYLQNSNIYSSELPNISFCNAKIVKTQFQDTNMYGARFENAFIAQSQFTASNNGQAELSRAALELTVRSLWVFGLIDPVGQLLLIPGMHDGTGDDVLQTFFLRFQIAFQHSFHEGGTGLDTGLDRIPIRVRVELISLEAPAQVINRAVDQVFCGFISQSQRFHMCFYIRFQCLRCLPPGFLLFHGLSAELIQELFDLLFLLQRHAGISGKMRQRH